MNGKLELSLIIASFFTWNICLSSCSWRTLKNRIRNSSAASRCFTIKSTKNKPRCIHKCKKDSGAHSDPTTGTEHKPGYESKNPNKLNGPTKSKSCTGSVVYRQKLRWEETPKSTNETNSFANLIINSLHSNYLNKRLMIMTI